MTREDPLALFARWQEAARRKADDEAAEAACLSTIDPDGWPEGRMVLVKRVDLGGFEFFTNRGSAKGRALDANPRACLTFYWHELGRQVRVQGPVERLSDAESDAYFATRPRWSQLGAWASEQSRPMASRLELARRVARAALEFRRRPVSRPPHWGGYRLVPRAIELWRRRLHRMHDRVVYRRENGGWRAERLFP